MKCLLGEWFDRLRTHTSIHCCSRCSHRRRHATRQRQTYQTHTRSIVRCLITRLDGHCPATRSVWTGNMCSLVAGEWLIYDLVTITINSLLHGSSDILTTPLGIQLCLAVSCHVILAVCKHSVNPTCLAVKFIVLHFTGKALSNTDPCRTYTVCRVLSAGIAEFRVW